MATYKNPYTDYALPNTSYRGGIYEDDSLKTQEVYKRALSAAEYDAAIQLMLDERDYTNYSSQVARMHDAGLNPNLLGTDSESSGQSPKVESPQTPAWDPQAKSRLIADASQQFLQMIPQALDVYSSFRGSMQSLEMNDIQMARQLQEMGEADVINAFTPEDFDDNGFLKDESLNKLSTISDMAMVQFGFNPNKKYNSRSASSKLKRYYKGVDSLVRINNERLRSGVYDKYYNGAINRSNYLRVLGEYGHNLSDEDFVNLLQDFNRLTFKADKSDAKNRYDSSVNNVPLNLMRSGQDRINKGDKVLGSIEYIIGILLQNNMVPKVSMSRSTDAKGQKSSSSSIGF